MYQKFCFWRFNRFFIFKMMHKQLLWQSSSENFFPLPSFAMFDRVRGSLCPGFLLWPSTVLRRSIWHLKFEMSNSEIGAGGDVELSKWFCRDSVKGSLLTYQISSLLPGSVTQHSLSSSSLESSSQISVFRRSQSFSCHMTRGEKWRPGRTSPK